MKATGIHAGLLVNFKVVGSIKRKGPSSLVSSRKMRYRILLLVLLVLGTCRPEKPVTVTSTEDYFSVIRTLELDPDLYGSHQRYYDSVHGRIKSWLNQIAEPERLRTLFCQCHVKWKAQPEAPQEKLSWICPYSMSLNLILYRLAEIKSETAAKTLVALFCDGPVVSGGHAACDAVVKCGRATLPFLRERRKPDTDDTDIITWLIKRIESGATTAY